MSVKTVRIHELPAVATPGAELPGALFEVEALTGPGTTYQNKQLTMEQLVAYLGITNYRLMTVGQAQDEATNTSLPGFKPGWLYRLTDRPSLDGDVVLFAITPRGLDEPNAWLVEVTPQQGGGTVETRTSVAYDLATDTTSARATGSGVMPAQLEAVRTSLTRSAERTASATLTAADFGNIVPVNTGGPATLTIAAGLGQPAPAAGQPGVVPVCFPMQTGPGLVTLAAAPGVNLLPMPGSGLTSTGLGCRWVLSWHDVNTVYVEGGKL